MANSSYNYSLQDLAKLSPANVFRYKSEVYKTVDEETKQAVSEKQDKLTAGEGITIKDNVISSTIKESPAYTAGNGITIENNVISAEVQKQLEAGNGIIIKDNTISVSDDLQTKNNLEAGTGISIKDETISVNLNSGNGINVSNDTISVKMKAGDNIDVSTDSEGSIVISAIKSDTVEGTEVDYSKIKNIDFSTWSTK